MENVEDINNWNNYWAGRTAGSENSALVGVGIDHNKVLREFWRSEFLASPKEISLVDFACGSGSVLDIAQKAGIKQLTGIDTSKSAIKLLHEKIPSANGICSSVVETPFRDNQFNLVVSQFGFEYAGTPNQRIQAATEISRVLDPSGKVVMISHIEDGAIARGCSNSLAQIDSLLESQFIDFAKQAFKFAHDADRSGNKSDIKKTQDSLRNMAVAIRPIIELLNDTRNRKNEFSGFLNYFVRSTHKLVTEHTNFHPNDGAKWFDQMHGEVLAYRGRMTSMLSSALSQKEVANIGRVLNSSGFVAADPEKLYFPNESKPIAWIIKTDGN